VVFIPKYRKKRIFGVLRTHLGDVFRKLAEQKESQIEEGHIMPDHVHMMISIPPKYSVASVVGYIKGKSAIHIARHHGVRSATKLTHSSLENGPTPSLYLPVELSFGKPEHWRRRSAEDGSGARYPTQGVG